MRCSDWIGERFAEIGAAEVEERTQKDLGLVDSHCLDADLLLDGLACFEGLLEVRCSLLGSRCSLIGCFGTTLEVSNLLLGCFCSLCGGSKLLGEVAQALLYALLYQLLKVLLAVGCRDCEWLGWLQLRWDNDLREETGEPVWRSRGGLLLLG